jgi:hypothetical protein
MTAEQLKQVPGVYRQRVGSHLVRDGAGHRLIPAAWEQDI